MFAASKLLWFLASPDNFLVLLAAVGAALLWTPWRRAGRWCAGLAAAGLLVLSWLPVGHWLLRPLEERFPHPVDLPAEVEGIIVLGGYQDQLTSSRRGWPELTGAADRLVAFVDLARRYPQARLVATGGSGLLLHQEVKESDVTRDALRRLGFDGSRVLHEDASRTTAENAVLSRAVARPSDDGLWLLVTSAAHMPRAVGVFRAQGWNVLAYPVDYRTTPEAGLGFPFEAGGRLTMASLAMHEWAGLLAYRLAGDSDLLFPGPCPAAR